jgi:hypothetical protein
MDLFTDDERLAIIASADHPHIAAPAWIVTLLRRIEAGAQLTSTDMHRVSAWFANQTQVQREAQKIFALLQLHAPMDVMGTGGFPGWFGHWWAETLQFGPWAENLSDAVGKAEAWLMGFSHE